ncbi:sugar ABC transporter ATP-binding protein [Clostridium fallax]|uniref:Monosaccharide ABC transporter ATP-binding protein, CUT2 family n=1 Tax=Clostridium fallax TaxID=1533 RepID=A0A1M4XDB5_9CLOT|nr:sugar ABC transporter ATP-binding protein [Clostridium fallax]SHE91425.1 monosaccharide ABC transporter ATP-binding protein, CUT2 family [Clostridium fallax]SQB05970.1 ABC transporter [Clostridium fallax]
MKNKILLRMEGISKSFSGVQALKNVSLEVLSGEVHVLIGENGAGKSTLMKILTGVYTKDSGNIVLKGKKFLASNTKEAEDKGVCIIHQEFNLIPHLTVAQNIYIGREPKKLGGLLIDDKKMIEGTEKLLKLLNLKVNPNTLVKNLTVAQQQMVEIAKALLVKSEILVLDEPTSALTQSEIEDLFKIIKRLRSEGVGIIYISHRMEEFNEIADRVTILRDGTYVGTRVWKETTIDEIIKMMVGRDLKDKYPKRNPKIGNVIFEAKNINRGKYIKDVSFSLRKGEILGFAGLMGAGRTELARAIFGADKIESGEFYLEGEKLNIKSPGDAIDKGIVYLSEDRKRDGLLLNLDVEANTVLANIKEYSKLNVVNDDRCRNITNEKVNDLKIKTPSIKQKTKFLSGGNQQKVLIGRWLCRDTKILIFDEPTRGIDVGAKFEVYTLIKDLAERGVAIIMISSELPEILGMSDRILVMHEGKKTGELDIEEATQESIMQLASGGIN